MNFPPPTPGQARVMWAATTGLAIGVLLGLLVLLVWALGLVLGILGPVLWPLAVAGVIAYLLDPVVDFIERRGVPRARSILCVFALAVVVVLAVFGSVLPQVARETQQLIEKVPSYTAGVEKRVRQWINEPPALLQRVLHLRGASTSVGTNVVAGTNEMGGTNGVVLEAEGVPPVVQAGPEWGRAIDSKTLQSAAAWLAKALPNAGQWLFGQATRVASWFGILAGLALVPVYAFYLLLEKRGIEKSWTDYLPVSQSNFKDELVFVLRAINDYLITFFRGQVLVAICDGVLYGVGFFLIGLPHAFLIGFVAIFLTIIPFLGAIVTCGAALLIAVLQFGDWLHPLLVLGVFGVVQFLEGFVIQPKVIGDRVGLHPLTIIIALMVGTTLLGGLLGGILAIPLTAALRVLMFRYVWKARDPRAVPAR